jgi:ATPase subunit of ABC transporter with duplicated ATPase domains
LDERLIGAAKVTRVLELHEDSKSVTSYTGTYESFTSEQAIQRTRSLEAYEKQQREKRRLEEWLEVKREEASRDKKAPEKGAVIRAKVKYLKREILDKELPKPSYGGETPETED